MLQPLDQKKPLWGLPSGFAVLGGVRSSGATLIGARVTPTSGLPAIYVSFSIFSEKPEVGVTRAPMSVAPEERTPPKTANPDGKPHKGFF